MDRHSVYVYIQGRFFSSLPIGTLVFLFLLLIFADKAFIPFMEDREWKALGWSSVLALAVNHPTANIPMQPVSPSLVA